MFSKIEPCSHFFGVTYNPYTQRWEASVIDKNKNILKKHCTNELQAAIEVRSFLQQIHPSIWPDTSGYSFENDFRHLIQDGWKYNDSGLWEELSVEDAAAQNHFENESEPITNHSSSENEDKTKYKYVYFEKIKRKWVTYGSVTYGEFATQELAAKHVRDWALARISGGNLPEKFRYCIRDESGYFLRDTYVLKRSNQREGTFFNTNNPNASSRALDSLSSEEEIDPNKYKWVCVSEKPGEWITYGNQKMPIFKANTQEAVAQHVRNWVLKVKTSTGRLPIEFRHCKTDDKGYFLRESYSLSKLKAAAAAGEDTSQAHP